MVTQIDEDDLKGDGCTEFNEKPDMKNRYFEIDMEFTNFKVFEETVVEFNVLGRYDIVFVQSDKINK